MIPTDVALDHPAITVLGSKDHTIVTCLCGWRTPATTHTAARARHREHQQAVAALTPPGAA